MTIGDALRQDWLRNARAVGLYLENNSLAVVLRPNPPLYGIYCCVGDFDGHTGIAVTGLDSDDISPTIPHCLAFRRLEMY